jgi:hypothetical protein
MSHSSYQQLLDRARKAGLGTSELYRALSGRQFLGHDTPPDQADSNGYVAQVQANGQRSYQPQATRI